MTSYPEAPDFSDLSLDELRRRVRDFVAEFYPAEVPRYAQRRLHWRENRPWYMALAKNGWLCPAWPRAYGGMALPVEKQLILLQEFERLGCARVNDIGIVMLGPLLIRHGTEAQKDRFLPAILSGEHIWAQGYSEPNAGSDLANVQTTAVADGDAWVLNGQKTWITLGNDANWIFVLARTDRDVKKQAGLSFFLVPMDAPGVTVRPILNLDLEDEFSEIFLDNVRVPADHLVGAVNDGWRIAKSLLGDERIFIGSPRLSSNALDRLDALARHRGVADDPAYRGQYNQLWLDLEDHAALFRSYVDRVSQGVELGPEVAVLKIHQSELLQRITDAMLDIAGEEAGLLEPLRDGRLNPAGSFLLARPTTIFGGTNEVMRNVIARSVLRLPG